MTADVNKAITDVNNITVIDVANAFITKFKEENKKLSHMQLQKLVYYAYALYLYNYNTPLFQNCYEPWAYGPVDRKLYKAIKGKYDPHNINKEIPNKSKKLTNKEKMLIKELVANISLAFKGWNAIELSQLTHTKGSAWNKALEDGEIEFLLNEDIKEEARKLFFS